MGARSTTVNTNPVPSSTSSTTRPRGEHESLVDVLMNSGRPKAAVERALAEMAQGIIIGIERSSISVFDAWDELFNIANYRSIRRHRLSPTIGELFTWGMELSNVARVAPEGLTESLDHMSKLAIRIMQSRRRKRAA